ncbi:MAG: tRNA (adenine-N1)-methyltransferase [Desulfovermiculus sp.]
MIHPGDHVQLDSPKGKRYLRVAGADSELHTHDGKLDLKSICDLDYGQCIRTHLDKEYRLFKPTLFELLKKIDRQTQIIYPKDIGYILLKLSIGPGVRVLEAGCGSGSLTLALAWFVGPQGRVTSLERRPEFARLCAKNLSKIGLLDRVDILDQDLSQGFDTPEADAVFIDVRTPWDYLDQIAAGVKNGHPVGFLLPTVNQVTTLLAAMQDSAFAETEVMELLVRHYKPVPDRFRPEDRMVAHTGFLIFSKVYKPTH